MPDIEDLSNDVDKAETTVEADATAAKTEAKTVLEEVESFVKLMEHKTVVELEAAKAWLANKLAEAKAKL